MAFVSLSSKELATGTFPIHYFATASQYTSKDTEHLPAPLPLSHLFPLLEKRYPGIQTKILCSCGVSLDGEYVDLEEDGERVIGVGEEVAIIPPCFVPNSTDSSRATAGIKAVKKALEGTSQGTKCIEEREKQKRTKDRRISLKKAGADHFTPRSSHPIRMHRHAMRLGQELLQIELNDGLVQQGFSRSFSNTGGFDDRFNA